jgi:hypothetical protein
MILRPRRSMIKDTQIPEPKHTRILPAIVRLPYLPLQVPQQAPDHPDVTVKGTTVRVAVDTMVDAVRIFPLDFSWHYCIQRSHPLGMHI